MPGTKTKKNEIFTRFPKLEKNVNYFFKHRDELAKKYYKKFAVIVDGKVAAIYENKKKAFSDAVKKYKAGTFIIQLCVPESEARKVKIRGRGR